MSKSEQANVVGSDLARVSAVNALLENGGNVDVVTVLKRRYSSRLNPTTRVLSRGCVGTKRVSITSHTTTTTLHNTNTSQRSDGSPPSMNGSLHGWVPVDSHSAPVLTAVRRQWVAHSPQAPQQPQDGHTT